MTLIDTVQLQETADSFIELFEITLRDSDSTTVYFTNGLSDGTENIYFGSSPTDADPTGGATLNEYVAIPIELKGVEFNAGGASPRPTLSLANIVNIGFTHSTGDESSSADSDETTLSTVLTENGFFSNDDLLGSTVVYRTTLLSKTKKASDLSGYSAATPEEFPSQKFVIERIASENALIVAFELASPFDIENVKVPGRVVVGQYCPWEYQGVRRGRPGGCSWDLNSRGIFFDVENNIITKDTDSSGLPNTSSNILIHSTSTTYNIGDLAFTKHKTVTTDDTIQIWKAKVQHSNKVPINTSNGNPTNGKYWQRHDVCGKTLTSCKLRFQGNKADTTLNESEPLPFGAFPGILRFK